MTLGCLLVLPRGTRGFKVLESRTVCTESESQVPPSSLPLRKHLHNHLPQQLQGANGGARQNVLSATALETLRRAPPRPWSLAAHGDDAGPAGWEGTDAGGVHGRCIICWGDKPSPSKGSSGCTDTHHTRALSKAKSICERSRPTFTPREWPLPVV